MAEPVRRETDKANAALIAAARRAANARLTLAWLMWCYAQGYTHPSDRAILTSWMDDDAAQLHPDDVIERERLLLMADEVLAALDGDGKD